MMEPARCRWAGAGSNCGRICTFLWLTSEHVCACDTDTEPAAYRRGPASSGRLQIAAVANPPPPQSTERKEREKPQQPPRCARAGESVAVLLSRVHRLFSLHPFHRSTSIPLPITQRVAVA